MIIKAEKFFSFFAVDGSMERKVRRSKRRRRSRSSNSERIAEWKQQEKRTGKRGEEFIIGQTERRVQF